MRHQLVATTVVYRPLIITNDKFISYTKTISKPASKPIKISTISPALFWPSWATLMEPHLRRRAESLPLSGVNECRVCGQYSNRGRRSNSEWGARTRERDIASEHICGLGLCLVINTTNHSVHKAASADDSANHIRREAVRLGSFLSYLNITQKTKERYSGHIYALRLQRRTALCPPYVDSCRMSVGRMKARDACSWVTYSLYSCIST